MFDIGTARSDQLVHLCELHEARTAKDGAAPGGHADDAEEDKYTHWHRQFGKEYVGLNAADSLPALPVAILAMPVERHGSFNKGTLEYWRAAVHVVHERQRTSDSELPVHLSVWTQGMGVSLHWPGQTLALAVALRLWRGVNASHIY